jgi:hypothetical protein
MGQVIYSVCLKNQFGVHTVNHYLTIMKNSLNILIGFISVLAFWKAIQGNFEILDIISKIQILSISLLQYFIPLIFYLIF